MILILTMAGKSERFYKEGYTLPKYLLPWGDRTVLYTVLSNLLRDDRFSDVYLIVNEHDAGFTPHVRHMMRSLELPPSNLILVSDTSGQAETAYLGINAASPEKDEPFVIHNIDTILLDRDVKSIEDYLQAASGYIDVFRSSNRGYSYVMIDSRGRVQEIAEKVVVSDLATSGLYGFANASIYRNYYEKYNCVYVSEIYKKMICNKDLVVVGKVHTESDTIVLGTPSEYTSASGRWV